MIGSPIPKTGVSAVGASVADVLSILGESIVAVDPGADRLFFWDDSATKATHLTLGTGLEISGTTLNSTASGGASINQAIAVGFVLN
jgi:hypothetical protein